MKIQMLAPMLLAGSLLAGMGPDRSPSARDVVAPPPKAIDRITIRTSQKLALPRTAGEPFSVAVILDGALHELDLSPYSMRAPDFRVLEAGADGVLREVPARAPATLRGSVKGMPASRVAASLIDGKLTAHVDLGGGAGVFCVQPESDLTGDPVAADEHVSFRAEDVLPHGFSCGNDEFGDDEEAPAEQAAAAAGTTGLSICELGLEGDYFFFLQNGSSIGNTISDIESVMNGVEFVYERDVAITYEITVIVVRTSPASDPYTSADPPTLLCEFRTQWNSGPENIIRRDVAQLFTGRAISGAAGTIGLAYLGTVCNVTGVVPGCGGGSLAYAIVESQFGGNYDERVALSAHELGHNWNAAHCSGDTCHIMCPEIDSCGGTTGEDLVFGGASKVTIAAFRDSRGCLFEQREPLTAPFFDDFPDSSFDLDKWIWKYYSTPSPDAIDPPSPPYALKLWSFGSADYRDGEIRSNEILLGGESDLILSYQVQWQGVESNEALFIQYLTSNGIWTDINFVASPGVDLGFFLEYAHDLPANAYHDGFRLRFQVEGNETDDVWYVDDVYIGPEGGGDPCPGDIDGSGDIGFQDLLSVLSNWGPCVDCPEDIDGSGDVGFADLLHVLSNWGPCP